MRPMDERTAEWESAFGLVISCLSEKTLAALLEGTKPIYLVGRPSHTLAYSYPNFMSEFTKFVRPP